MGSDSNKAFVDLGINSISDYTEGYNNEDCHFVKVGGEPRFIQYEDFYYEKLE